LKKKSGSENGLQLKRASSEIMTYRSRDLSDLELPSLNLRKSISLNNDEPTLISILPLPKFHSKISKFSKLKRISRLSSVILEGKKQKSEKKEKSNLVLDSPIKTHQFEPSNFKKLKVEKNGVIAGIIDKAEEESSFEDEVNIEPEIIIPQQNKPERSSAIENWDMNIPKSLFDKRQQIFKENRDHFFTNKKFKDEYDIDYDKGRAKKVRAKKEVNKNDFDKTYNAFLKEQATCY